MQVKASVVNPEEVLVAMTIEMPLRSWKDLRQALARHPWQRSDTHSAVWEVLKSLDQATSRIEQALIFEDEGIEVKGEPI